MAEASGGEKSELPTPKKRDDARENGQVAFSSEVNTSGMLLVALITIPGRVHRYQTTRRLRHQLAAADASVVAREQPIDPSIHPIGSPIEQRVGQVAPVAQGEDAP